MWPRTHESRWRDDQKPVRRSRRESTKVRPGDGALRWRTEGLTGEKRGRFSQENKQIP